MSAGDVAVPVDVAVLRDEIRRTYTDVSAEPAREFIFVGNAGELWQGELVDTYARSAFADTRRKAAKFGAMGSTIRAFKP